MRSRTSGEASDPPPRLRISDHDGARWPAEASWRRTQDATSWVGDRRSYHHRGGGRSARGGPSGPVPATRSCPSTPMGSVPPRLGLVRTNQSQTTSSVDPALGQHPHDRHVQSHPLGVELEGRIGGLCAQRTVESDEVWMTADFGKREAEMPRHLKAGPAMAEDQQPVDRPIASAVGGSS